MKNRKRTTVALSALIALLCGGCGKVYDYELEQIANLCGGYEQIKSTWVDGSTARAYCKNGKMVSPKD